MYKDSLNRTYSFYKGIVHSNKPSKHLAWKQKPFTHRSTHRSYIYIYSCNITMLLSNWHETRLLPLIGTPTAPICIWIVHSNDICIESGTKPDNVHFQVTFHDHYLMQCARRPHCIRSTHDALCQTPSVHRDASIPGNYFCLQVTYWQGQKQSTHGNAGPTTTQSL